jgi:molybdopterin molybdotransferase
MITVEQHLAAVLALATPPRPARSLPLTDCLGLVLARDVASLLAVPPFTNSAMDGYAVRAADIAAAPVTLAVGGDIPAGPAAGLRLEPGTALRIMTGGALPEGADTVVPVELTDQPRGASPLPARVRITQAVPLGRHVRLAGDDVAVGARVLAAGAVVTPAALACAASTGHAALWVRPAPRVLVVATGAELVEPGVPPGPGQIPDSNSLLLAGLVRRCGAEIVRMVRVGDEVDELAAVLADLAGIDLVLTTGGVSVGAFDVLRLLPELGFAEVAMQPGKPQGLGLLGGVPLLAFPGNPVSVFVSFLLFARPLLAVLAGGSPRSRLRRVVAGAPWPSPPGRRQYLPARLEGEVATPVHRLGSGSHLIASLPLADALVLVGEDITEVRVGDPLDAMEV